MDLIVDGKTLATEENIIFVKFINSDGYKATGTGTLNDPLRLADHADLLRAKLAALPGQEVAVVTDDYSYIPAVPHKTVTAYGNASFSLITDFPSSVDLGTDTKIRVVGSLPQDQWDSRTLYSNSNNEDSSKKYADVEFLNCYASFSLRGGPRCLLKNCVISNVNLYYSSDNPPAEFEDCFFQYQISNLLPSPATLRCYSKVSQPYIAVDGVVNTDISIESVQERIADLSTPIDDGEGHVCGTAGGDYPTVLGSYPVEFICVFGQALFLYNEISGDLYFRDGYPGTFEKYAGPPITSPVELSYLARFGKDVSSDSLEDISPGDIPNLRVASVYKQALNCYKKSRAAPYFLKMSEDVVLGPLRAERISDNRIRIAGTSVAVIVSYDGGETWRFEDGSGVADIQAVTPEDAFEHSEGGNFPSMRLGDLQEDGTVKLRFWCAMSGEAESYISELSTELHITGSYYRERYTNIYDLGDGKFFLDSISSDYPVIVDCVP
ncbi:MAG: hypothetical protein LBF78_12750 [Treponema sp.]|jgi:hypothetical protein|nr:hypothetical protein [Treponema sp.]